MTQARFYASSAFPTTLAASLGASGNPSVNSIVGLPSQRPYTVVIDWGLVTQEAISVTSAPTGSGPWTLPCTRGIDGTTAQSHVSGAIAVHGVTAQDYNQWSGFIDSLTGTAASNFGQLAVASTYTADQRFKSGSPWYDVKGFGALGNSKTVTDGAMTATSATLTSASAGFAITDVGKTAIVAGAGTAGAFLNAAITGWTSTTQVTLASTAATTVSSAVTDYGSDDTTACQAAINAQQASGGVVFFPPGTYLVNGATTGAGLICALGTGGSWSNATRPLIIRGSGRDCTTLLSGNQWAGGGLLTAGSSGVNVQCALTDVADITLDGNYSGSGGALGVASVTQGALVNLPWPYTNPGGSPSRNGQYHVFSRVRFYRPTAYGFQPTTGVKCVACDTLDGGQPDQPTVHYDNFGSGQADAILISHTWKDSSGNYCDFVATSGFIRLIMIGCESFNHGPGGVYGCGNRSVITGNNLDASAGGIGYDSGTSAGLKSSNIVASNNCPNMSVKATLNFHSFGDLVYANISSDQSTSGNLDIAGTVVVQNALVLGTATNTPVGSPSVTSDGADLFLNGTGSGGSRFYFRPDGYGVSTGQMSLDTTGLLYLTGPTATTATAGSQTLPANPTGFLEVNIGGTTYKLPYYST